MYIKILLVMVACVVFSNNTHAESKVDSGKKKNLLFIITDQQQSKALGIAGSSVVKTPNLDRLAKQGVYFKNAYTPSAVCAPARSSILTGHSVENTGVTNNNKAYLHKEEGLMTMPTFDEVLTDAGYHAEYYGKWHSQTSHSKIYKNPKLTSKDGHSVFEHKGQSFVYLDFLDEHEPIRPLKKGELYDNTMTRRPYRSDPLDKYHNDKRGETLGEGPLRVQPDSHGELMMDDNHSFTAFQAMETIEAIERLKDKQFSITVSFHLPHSPILPTKSYYNMYPADDMVAPASIADDMNNSPYKTQNGRLGLPQYSDPDQLKYMISNYYGLITEVDVWVGKILDTLEEQGIAENTLVIFTSDHGEMLGAHGMREKNVFYEESAHIPLLMRFPDAIKPETQVDGYVSLVDLFATILDYMDVKEQPSDGTSLRGLIEGTNPKQGEYAVTEWLWSGDKDPNYMVINDGWKLLIPFSKESKVINAMYNLNDDPHEMNNLLGSNPDRKKYQVQAEKLRSNLLEWLKKNKSKHVKGVSERALI